MVIAITGHRPNKLGNDYALKTPLVLWIKKELQKRIELYNPSHIMSGMALGIDTLWAGLALENGIPLIAAIPCLHQESKWPYKSIKIYNDIVSHPLCTKVLVSEKPYSVDCMQRRNIYMADNCHKAIAVWDGSPGGTGNFVSYANSILLDIDRINPKDFISA